jgi:cell division protein FtsZ
MVFVTTGLGGGTGTGAAPIIASLASELGALTVAVVTKPFSFEGKRRMAQAERGIAELMESVDTTIVIPNEKLLAVAEDAGFFESFQIADDILRQGVQGISDIITIPGIINRDFADVKTIMARMGYAVMGTASASGPKRTIEAAQKAIASPLLEAGAIDGARGIRIQSAAHEDANIIFGAVMDEKMKDSVKITVIATGFREAPSARSRPLEVRTSFSAAPATQENAMEFSEDRGSRDFIPEPPKHIMESTTPEESMTQDSVYSDDITPAPLAHASDHLAGEVISLDSMRDNIHVNMHDDMRNGMVANFEQDDLDVPAFLRKRNEVM